MREPFYAMCKQQRRRSACSLISAVVVCYLDSVICVLPKSGISRLLLVSVAEQAGLSLTRSQTPKIGFLVKRLNYNMCMCVDFTE